MATNSNTRGANRNQPSKDKLLNSSYPQLYVGQAPQNMGQYQSMFDANPYRNLRYNKTGWQSFLSDLGFRTSADKFAEDAALNAAEFDASIYSLMFQNEYNDEFSKVERMRAAGENPDLLGTGQVSDAAQPTVDPNGMASEVGEENAIFGQVSSTILSCLGNSFQLAEQFMKLSEMKNGIERGSIENAGEMMNIIEQRVLGLTPSEGFKTDEEFNNWKRRVESTLRTNYGRSFFRGSSLRRWNRTIDDFIGGLPQSRKQYEQWSERLGKAKDFWLNRHDHWDDSISVLKTIYEGLGNIRHATVENEYSAKLINSEADVEQAGNRLETEQMIEPGLEPGARNEENRARISNAKIRASINDAIGRMVNELEKEISNGGWSGFLAQIFLMLMGSNMPASIPMPKPQ